MDRLVGKGLARVALPPAKAITKSLFSISPFPSLLLKTASLKVMVSALLSLAREMLDISGGALSFSVWLLLFCDVLALLPLASNTEFALGLMISFSFPSGTPFKLNARWYVLPSFRMPEG